MAEWATSAAWQVYTREVTCPHACRHRSISGNVGEIVGKLSGHRRLDALRELFWGDERDWDCLCVCPRATGCCVPASAHGNKIRDEL